MTEIHTHSCMYRTTLDKSVMSAAVPSPLRAGTKSCSECRRRKVKCTWTSENARACRRCEERGSVCESQVRTSELKERRKLSSKDRIARLEAQLSRLNGTVVSLHSRLDGQTPGPAATANSTDGFESLMHDTVGEDDKSSSDSEVVEEDLQTRLYSLFENDVVSTDTQENIKAKHEQSSRSVISSLNTARTVLQRFIPPRSDIEMKSGHVPRWQRLLHEIMPLAAPPESTEELLSSYDSMIQPDVDAMKLAAWLLGIAVVTQQALPEDGSPTGMVRQYQNRSSYVRALAEAVETHILSHDSVIGTVRGISLALMNARAQISTHPIHKMYLNLRRAIAFSELIGLPRAAKIVALHTGNRHPSQDSMLEVKASLWNSICSINKVLCVILNFPCASLSHASISGQSLVVDGVVQPREYISHLSEIASKVYDIDDLSTEPGMEADLYASILRCDTDLRLLYAKVPPQWWHVLPDEICPSHVIQFMHHCVAMRVHLTCTLRRDQQGKYSYIRQAGLHACYEVAKRWLVLRKSLPLGFFICRVIDVQAFTAAMVLLLASKQAQIKGGNQIPETECLPEVVAMMEEKARDQVGSDIAAQAVNVIHSLTGMLHRGESDAHGSLKLTIPRLGKIYVWCNGRGAGMNSRLPDMSHRQVSSERTWHDPPSETLQCHFAGEMSNGLEVLPSSEFIPEGPVSWLFENDYGAMFDGDFLDATFEFPSSS